MSALTNLKAAIITLSQKMLTHNYKLNNGQDTYGTDLSQAIENYCEEKITEEGLVPPEAETDPVFNTWKTNTPPAYPGDALSQFTEDVTHRTVTDSEKADWNSKSDGAHNHNLNDLTEKSYSSLTDVPDLSSLHSHANAAALDDVSGENTGDETALSIITKIGNGTLIDSTYLPSYVDDVIEGYLLLGIFYEDAAHTIPITGETGKIYIDIENSNNDEYRWTGTVYANITNPLDYASKSDAETGTDTTKVMPAVRVKDSILYQFSNAVISTLNTASKNLVGAVNELLSKIVTTWTATPLDTNIPSEKLVKDSLDLKADITPVNGSTSALRALFIARGYDSFYNTYHCVYNENTGYYEMNGLTDITEDEISVIYNYSTALHNVNLRSALSNTKCRTLYPLKFIANNSYDISYIFQRNNVLEAFFTLLYSNFPADVSIMIGAFYGCTNLKIVNGLRASNITNAASVLNAFYDCQNLEDCYLHGVKVAFSFAWSPLLSLASLQYLVTNRGNGTTRITITVHATVWAKLNDAVNYPTWNALLVNAVNNQYIDFASA